MFTKKTIIPKVLLSILFCSSTLLGTLPTYAADHGCNGGAVDGGVSVQCSTIAPDITASFTTILHTNADRAYSEFKNSAYMGVGSLIYMYGWWYNQVKIGGPWDYKLTYGSNTKYTFRGQVVTGEYLGNLHYGYVGKAARFTDAELKAGGGFAAFVAKTHDWSNISGYFDGREDTQAIEDGFALYRSGY